QLDDARRGGRVKNQPKVPMKSLFLICAAFALCICGGVWQLRGKTPVNATATLQFSDGESITLTDFSNQIAVQPRELVNVTLQLNPAWVGQPIIVEAPDGGSTSVGSSIPVIDADGGFSFAFLTPAKTGMKSIGVRIGATTYRLQFSVANQP